MSQKVHPFFKDVLKVLFYGSKRFYMWMSGLTFLALVGIYCYSIQLSEGLIVTGMTDQVSWGLYISNFTFFVGIAAAAVMLVIPLYVFGDKNFSHAVLIGEGLAISSLIMCILFVVVESIFGNSIFDTPLFMAFFTTISISSLNSDAKR